MLKKQKKFNIPDHIAIIMDGNGRWATRRGFKRIIGHYMGAKRIIDIIKNIDQLNIKYITLYVFSEENWNRPLSEINKIMNLINYFISKYTEIIIKKKINIKIIGFIDKLPIILQQSLLNLVKKTEKFNNFNIILAISYSGRKDIIQAIKKITYDIINKKIKLDEITEKLISEEYILTKKVPDPDLLIRTGGDKRISNFLLWQLSYAELYFTELEWPDFSKKELIKAINDFTLRSRRYGSICTGKE